MRIKNNDEVKCVKVAFATSALGLFFVFSFIIFGGIEGIFMTTNIVWFIILTILLVISLEGFIHLFGVKKDPNFKRLK